MRLQIRVDLSAEVLTKNVPLVLHDSEVTLAV